jgi:hypothetical protein
MPTTKGERQEDTGKATRRSARKGKGKEKGAGINAAGLSGKDTTSNDDSIPWNWSYLAEPQVSKLSPVFTKDAK